MKWYLKVLKQYVDFKGRARRKEYWMFFLFNFLVGVVVNIIEIGTGNQQGGVLMNIYQLFILLPALAVGVRRMHDVGKSGWFLLIPIYNLILLCTEGMNFDNEYGTDPKANNV